MFFYKWFFVNFGLQEPCSGVKLDLGGEIESFKYAEICMAQCHP